MDTLFILGTLCILGGLILLTIYFIDRGTALKLAENFILEVITNAPDYALAGLEQNDQGYKEWVYGWYNYLPKRMKIFITKEKWYDFVDWSMERLKEESEDI